MDDMHYVGHTSDHVLTANPTYDNHSQGYGRTPLVDHTTGSVHTGLSLSQLAEGGTLSPHVHSYEEGFYVLSGQAVAEINGQTHLLGPGHILLKTRFGDFDCLGTIDAGRSYEDLLPASIPLEFEGRTLRFLHLREVLAIKKRAGRPKDLAAIPYIESTIDEIERGT